MSSVPAVKDDSVAVGSSTVPTDQGQSESSQEYSDSESKLEETTQTTPESHKDGNQSIKSQNSTEEDRNEPASSPLATEEVDSRRRDNLPSGSGNTKPTTRILLKRRRSRISTPTVAEEVDSAPPRAPKRRSQKKQMVALFLESDYPRRK